jgi:hypothetical protein
MAKELEEIKRHIDTGDLEAARHSLSLLTSTDPLNSIAWELLASITDDPIERAECYRHILQIDPENRPVAAKFLEISSQIQGPSLQERSVEGNDPFLYCKGCGGPAEVHFVGSIQDRSAICSYCGTEVDLPDSYHHIQDLRIQNRLSAVDDHVPTGKKITPKQDGLPILGDTESYPPELQKIIQILNEKGTEGLSNDHIIKLRETGAILPLNPGDSETEIVQDGHKKGSEKTEESSNSQTMSTTIKSPWEKISTFIKQQILKRRNLKYVPNPLSFSERLLLSGSPLPPEERQNCLNPQCKAVISKSAKACPWCGSSL